MLKFYRHTTNRFTRWVENKLEKMVVAHKVFDVSEEATLPSDIDYKKLPVLSDGRESWTSEDGIREFLEKLHQDLQLSQSLQSDACHLDPDNPDECL